MEPEHAHLALRIRIILMGIPKTPTTNHGLGLDPLPHAVVRDSRPLSLFLKVETSFKGNVSFKTKSKKCDTVPVDQGRGWGHACVSRPGHRPPQWTILSLSTQTSVYFTEQIRNRQ